MRFWRAAAILWTITLLLGVWFRFALAERPEQFFERAQRLVASNRLDEAELALRRFLALEPHRTDARLLLAKLAHNRNDWATVAAVFRGVPDLDPMAGPIRVAEGDAWLRLGRAALAKDCWTRAYRLSPEDSQPRFRLIYLNALQLRREPWVKLLWELYDRDQAGLREMIQLMIAGHVVWEAEEAMQHVRRFADADADDITSRRAVAEYLLLAGQIPGAIAELESIIQTHPNDAETWLALIECHLAKADHENARKCLKLIPDLAQADYRYWKNRGNLALLDQRVDDAVSDFAKALAKVPFDRELHHKMAQSLRLAGNLDSAERHGQIAAKLAKIHRLCHSLHHQRTPSLSDVHQLVELCEELGLIEEALGWTKLGLELEQTDADLLDARDRLSALPATSSRHPPPSEDPR